MTVSEWIGAAGVTMLLAAYALNLLRICNSDALLYTSLNVAGAGLACYSSWLIRFYPFVVLEGAWTLISVVGLIKSITRK